MILLVWEPYLKPSYCVPNEKLLKNYAKTNMQIRLSSFVFIRIVSICASVSLSILSFTTLVMHLRVLESILL